LGIGVASFGVGGKMGPDSTVLWNNGRHRGLNSGGVAMTEHPERPEDAEAQQDLPEPGDEQEQDAEGHAWRHGHTDEDEENPKEEGEGVRRY
jgi:hypothetical protein